MTVCKLFKWCVCQLLYSRLVSDNLELVTQARKLEGEMSALKEKVGGEERREREGEEKREECSKRRRKVKKRFLVLGMIFEIMTPIGHGPCNSRCLCVYIHIYMFRHRSPITLDHKPSTDAGLQGRGGGQTLIPKLVQVCKDVEKIEVRIQKLEGILREQEEVKEQEKEIAEREAKEDDERLAKVQEEEVARQVRL